MPTRAHPLRTNIARNISPAVSPTGAVTAKEVLVEGHSWGELEDAFSVAHNHAFDRVFVPDHSAEARCWFVAGFHTGRPMMRASVEEASLTDAGSEVQRIWELDCDGEEREWMWDRGIEDVTVRKRWLIVGILKRKIAGNENGA
ncbi:hypothetical protein Cob_v005650 [Colletotrichum orbiculare MAFF 240422]|uniref:Uncharacterized protein n=1 Tax=Colletotrichum orbiculare (strain 104-T / ATCC 96160 / CBS 514.97 / LARS 414 / MAFF 240422) TaxID=1213857 RepID=N4VID5_COLOR|nr:hypothetical protein Cob_v005650 [Colletotrichum orbiculare MAFF 240422]